MAPAINSVGLYQQPPGPTLFDLAQLLQVFQQAYNPFENVPTRALYSPLAEEEFVVEYYIEEVITIEFPDTPAADAPSLLEVATIEVGPSLFDEQMISFELLDAPARPILDVQAKTAPKPTPAVIVEDQVAAAQAPSNGELRKREAAADPGSPAPPHSLPKLTSVSAQASGQLSRTSEPNSTRHVSGGVATTPALAPATTTIHPTIRATTMMRSTAGTPKAPLHRLHHRTSRSHTRMSTATAFPQGFLRTRMASLSTSRASSGSPTLRSWWI
jgi:hypothetical protein